MTKELTERQGIFTGITGFESGQRIAKLLSESELVPQNFRRKVADCVIALDIAQRLNASPMMVMQSLYIVHGKPSFSAKFVISTINTCGRFTPLKYRFNEARTTCRAYATEISTGEILEGPEVSLEMAKKEGWSTKSGSKWQAMPELMLMYRAASFFGNTYAPELGMGMRTVEEVEDISGKSFDYEIMPDKIEPEENTFERLAAAVKKPAETSCPEIPDNSEPEVMPEINRGIDLLGYLVQSGRKEEDMRRTLKNALEKDFEALTEEELETAKNLFI